MSKGFQRVNLATRPTDTIHDQFKVTPVYTVQAVGEFAPYACASVVSQRKIYDMHFTVFSNILAQAVYRRRVLREP